MDEKIDNANLDVEKDYSYSKNTLWYTTNYGCDIESYFEAITMRLIGNQDNCYMFGCIVTKEFGDEEPMETYDFNLVWNKKKNIVGMYKDKFEYGNKLLNSIDDRYQEGGVYHVEELIEGTFENKPKYAPYV